MPFLIPTIHVQSHDDRGDGLTKAKGDKLLPTPKDPHIHTSSGVKQWGTPLYDAEPSPKYRHSPRGQHHNNQPGGRGSTEDSSFGSPQGGYSNGSSNDQFKHPIDFTYRPKNLPKIAQFYHDPWVASLKIDDPNTAKLLAAGGYDASFTYTRAIVSAFTGIGVGLRDAREKGMQC